MAFDKDMLHSQLFVTSLLTAIALSFIAFKCNFFSLPQQFRWEKASLSLYDIFVPFAILVIVKIFIAPAVFQIGYYFKTGHELTRELLEGSVQMHGWLHIVGIMILFSLLRFYITFNPRIFQLIKVRNDSHSFLKSLVFGMLAWFVVYPWVLFAGEGVSSIMAYFFKGPFPDQTAVREIRSLYSYPHLFWLMTFVVVCLVPIIEELLFRGLLQTWMRPRLGRYGAIIMTSAIFAVAHFSVSQGLFNIELITSLFVLSCFLGFLWEKRGSLVEPIALHASVNAVSMGVIFLGQLGDLFSN